MAASDMVGGKWAVSGKNSRPSAEPPMYGWCAYSEWVIGASRHTIFQSSDNEGVHVLYIYVICPLVAERLLSLLYLVVLRWRKLLKAIESTNCSEQPVVAVPSFLYVKQRSTQLPVSKSNTSRDPGSILVLPLPKRILYILTYWRSLEKKR